MLNLFLLVVGLPVSQWVGESVLASLPKGKVWSWFLSFFAQYVFCLMLLLVFDRAPLGQASEAATALAFFVRWFYFIKRLKRN